MMCKNTATYTINNKKNRPFKFRAFLIIFFTVCHGDIARVTAFRVIFFRQKAFHLSIKKSSRYKEVEEKKLSKTGDCKFAFLNIIIQLTYKTKKLHSGTANLQLRLVKGVAAQLNF